MIDASVYSYFLKRKNGCYEVHVVEQTDDKGSKRSANPAIAITAEWMMRYKSDRPSSMSSGAEIRLRLHRVSPKAHMVVGLCVNVL